MNCLTQPRASTTPGSLLTRISWFAFLFATCSSVIAEDGAVRRGLLNSFDLPLEELHKKEYKSELRNALSGLTLGLSYSYSASRAADSVGINEQGSRQSGSPTASLNWKYSPLGAWFASGSLVKYQEPEKQQPWNPDYTYCFGYNDWRPYTLSLTYCNYGGNRFSPEDGNKSTNFDEGGWTLGYKFPAPKKLQELMLIDQRGSIGCSVSSTYVKNFTDAATNSQLNNKIRLSFGCKYTIWGWWYWNFQLNHYPKKDQKQPWDPDYTYGFGYFDWHPGKLSFQYNNYSGNRFPGSSPAQNTGRFRNGNFSVSWSHSF